VPASRWEFFQDETAVGRGDAGEDRRRGGNPFPIRGGGFDLRQQSGVSGCGGKDSRGDVLCRPSLRYALLAAGPGGSGEVLPVRRREEDETHSCGN